MPELSRVQLLIGSVGLTFLPLLKLYQLFFGLRASEHFLFLSVAIILWMVGVFFFLINAPWDTSGDDPLETYFNSLGLLTFWGAVAGVVIALFAGTVRF